MKTINNSLLAMLCMVTVIATLGCADGETANSDSGGVAVAPPPPAAAATQPAQPDTTLAADPANENHSNENVHNSDAPVAEVGFGAKGHYDSNDYISVAVSTQFRVQEQITLLRITNALQQYKAIHEGYPKTHDVFWKEIIEANGIQLPELKAGEKFFYDPDLAKETNGEESLRILRPKKQ